MLNKSRLYGNMNKIQMNIIKKSIIISNLPNINE